MALQTWTIQSILNSEWYFGDNSNNRAELA